MQDPSVGNKRPTGTAQLQPFDMYNPFADPSVQQAAGNNAVRTQEGLENYNPFDAKASAARDRQPMTAIQPDPVISLGQIQESTMNELQKRQEELERKAKELDKREEELKHYTPVPGSQVNNWPPLPAKFCVEPCFYQDIDVEIAPEFQKIVRLLYYMWMFHAIVYLANVFGCLALFIQVGEGTTFGLSVLYCILFTPASYVCWFRPVYKAFRTDSSFNFMVFFVIFFAQLGASVIQAIGFPGLGTCGFIVGLSAMSPNTPGNLAVGIIALLIGVGFGLAAFGDFVLIVRVSHLYRSSGGSLSKASAEVTQQVMNDPVVRDVTARAVSATIESNFRV